MIPSQLIPIASLLADAGRGMASDPYLNERLLGSVLLQICVIIAAARIGAVLAKKVRQPAVVGEIIAGLVLGPSVFGRIEELLWTTGKHPISNVIFASQTAPTFNMLKELGLVFLLFLIGLEFDFTHLRDRAKTAVSVSVAGVAFPFALGYGLARLIAPTLEIDPVDVGGFSLFMGTAMSITALPVLGRMLMEWNVMRTRIGAISIAAAAAGDASGWILLAGVSAAVRTRFELWSTLWMVGMVAGFALAMVSIVRPVLAWWISRAMAEGTGTMNLNGMAAVLVLVFLCAVGTSLIGIFAIFGAFLLGAVLSDQHAFRDLITGQMRNFITVFFLPIFFTYTGLRTDIGTFDRASLWLIAGAVILTAIAGKMIACTLAARAGGLNWRDSSVIGALMNTRGLMELIVINVGWELGVIPKSVFCMLVLMAVITTVMTTPLMLALMRGTEFEPHLIAGGFALRREDSQESALAASVGYNDHHR